MKFAVYQIQMTNEIADAVNAGEIVPSFEAKNKMNLDFVLHPKLLKLVTTLMCPTSQLKIITTASRLGTLVQRLALSVWVACLQFQLVTSLYLKTAQW
jgi:hypothetical protein